MAIKVDLCRPDDLLHLQIEGQNLRLDSSDAEQPVLVIEEPTRPAFLIVVFPPQSIAESCFFESSNVTPEGDPARPDTDPPTTPTEPLPPPGGVKARMAGRSRLVFQVPPGMRIPFTTAGLLDWTALQPSVHPVAAVPADPTPEQIAAAPAISAPAPTHTALELPYRLIISPNTQSRWAHRLQPFTRAGRTELWHTRLQLASTNGTATELSRQQTAPLRAIWSPDYRPSDPPDLTAPDPDLGRTAMSPSDRHQIVVLTSAFQGYEVDRQFPFFSTTFGGGFASAASRRVSISRTVSYVPEPFHAERLMLSSLGGWLRSRGNWDPPRRSKPPVFQPPIFTDIFRGVLVNPNAPAPPLPPVQPVPPANPLGNNPLGNLARISTTVSQDLLFPSISTPPLAGFVPDQLDLSEWVHVATQGRDHYVRIVYEGELWPYRNRAALIKVTERKFRESGGLIVAYLFQRMFIVVREPEKTFSASDRGMPFKKVRLTTVVTPNIAEPVALPGTQRSFWVEVNPGPNRFKFHAVGTDVAGDQVDFTIPMMFVSLKDITENRAKAAEHYNVSTSATVLNARNANVPGQKIVFAERSAAQPGDNTQLVTRALNFVMDAAGNGPKLLKADVNIPQVQELLGSDAPTSIRFFNDYVQSGFDAATGVFAEVVKEDFSKFLPADPFAGLVANTLGVDFASDQAGGFATPNMGVSTLTRALGPVAGKAAKALTDTFDPSEFFAGGIAKLFGSFDLANLLPGGKLGKNAPKLKTDSQDIAGGKLLIATLDWEPEVKNLDLTIVAFEKDNGGTTKLEIHGRIEKPVTIDSLGAPLAQDVKFDFNGKLNDFRIIVLKMVFINFKEFSFVAKSGAKTDVKVKLDPAKPLEFAGDLKFVEEIRKIIPPDLFGDGPSLDIAPTGIRVGFAFALPPVSVGVFALKDVSLGAALTLPFLDGKPTLDFNVSTREHPFLLAVMFFGGGGFFRLQLDTAGIKIVEAAFEFGAQASIDLGVASGGVYIMAGIYFKLERVEPSNDLVPTLSGYLRLGGYLSVLGLIKISLEFNLSFTYDGAKDKAFGRATLTVKVEVLFFSTSVDVTVERGFGGKNGDPKFIEQFTAAPVWSEYAEAFA